LKKLLGFLLIIGLAMIQPAAAEQLNRVAAVVNGNIITMYDLERNAYPELARAHINPNNPSQKSQADAIMHKVLDMMILDILYQNEAKRLKVDVSDADVDKEITNMYRSRRMTKQQFEQALARDGMTLTQLRRQTKSSLLRQKVLSQQVGRRTIVTPDEIKAYYEAHKSSMLNRNGLHMQVLIYNPNCPYREIAAKVKSGAMSWHEAFTKYAVNRSQADGDAGVVKWDRLNAEWKARLNAMQPGDITDLFPYNAQLKAQVRLYSPTGEKSLRIMTLQEATPYIDAKLRDPKADSRLEDFNKELKSKAIIEMRY